MTTERLRSSSRGRHRRGAAQRSAPDPDPVATFSILGYDPETGEVGGAVQSRVFSVGNGVLWGEADVGMVATQAIVDVSYGPKALALLKRRPEAGRRSSRRSGRAIPIPASADAMAEGRAASSR